MLALENGMGYMTELYFSVLLWDMPNII